MTRRRVLRDYLSLRDYLFAQIDEIDDDDVRIEMVRDIIVVLHIISEIQQEA